MIKIKRFVAYGISSYLPIKNGVRTETPCIVEDEDGKFWRFNTITDNVGDVELFRPDSYPYQQIFSLPPENDMNWRFV